MHFWLIVGFTKSEAQRQGKSVGGFGGKFESMFHNADNVPETSFTCSSQQFPGLYADTEAECRVRMRWRTASFMFSESWPKNWFL